MLMRNLSSARDPNSGYQLEQTITLDMCQIICPLKTVLLVRQVTSSG